jgi:hypothetical protein
VATAGAFKAMLLAKLRGLSDVKLAGARDDSRIWSRKSRSC